MNETESKNKGFIHAVVILNYNDWKTCYGVIDSIIDYACIDYIVVVDNESSDDSFVQLRDKYAGQIKVKLIESGENKGYAYGNNVGCKYAIKKLQADYVTIANPDVLFTEETMIAILDFMRSSDDNVGVVGCMMNCHSQINLPTAWKLPGYRECVMENLIILRRILGDKTLYDKNYFDSEAAVQVEAIAGSFYTVNSNAFTIVGGFDENVFLYCEENILGWRMKEAGFQEYILTKYRFEHMHSVSIDKTYKKIKDRLDISYTSRAYYAKHYLQCSRLQMTLLNVTYKIGCFNYLIARALRNIFSAKKSS